MQRGLHRLLQRLVHALGDDAVQAGTFVHLVEVQEALAFEDEALAVAGFHRRAVGVVEHALHQIAGGQQILQALLVLDADGLAAEVIRDAQRCGVHLALKAHLIAGERGSVVLAQIEFHAALHHPPVNRECFTVRNLLRLVIKGALAQPLLEHAAGMQRMIGDDGVEHAHAALVEHAHDGLVLLQVLRQAFAKLLGLGRHFDLVQKLHVRQVVGHLAALQPLAQLACEEVIFEILAPERGVLYTRLGQRAIQIQHAHKARPLAAPVGHRQDRALVRGQSRQHVVRVLPHGLGDDDGRFRIDVAKHFHAHFLRVDEAVLLHRIERMRALHRPALLLQRPLQGRFHGLLRWPARLIGGETQIATGDEEHGLGGGLGGHRWSDQ